MSTSTKARTGRENSVWRFLYRAQVVLSSAPDAEAVCATAVRLAVPRLAAACTVVGLGGMPFRTGPGRPGIPSRGAAATPRMSRW